MSYQVSWIVPNRIIFIELTGSGPESEALEIDQTLVNMMDAGDAEMIVIHQVVHFVNYASDAGLKTLSTLKSPTHPRAGWVAVAAEGVNPVFRAISSLAVQIGRIKVIQRKTVEEALLALYQLDGTLPQEYAPVEVKP